MKQNWTKILSNSRCGTSNDFREAFKHVLFSNVFPTTLPEQTLDILPRGFCRMFFEVSPGLQLAVSLAGCLGVPCGGAGHGSSPCGELHFAGRTSETWSKKGILVGFKLFWRPKCRNFRNKLNDMSLHHSFNLFYINVYST